MFSLITRFFGGIPALYLWGAAAVVFAGWTFLVNNWAVERTENKAAAAQLKEVAKAQAKYQKEVIRGNALADKLAKQEANIVYQTKEVIKYVPQVTTGRPCLSAAAVRLLNNRTGDPTVPAAPSKPAAESPAETPATDTDVTYWAAEANGQYELCASRLNTLIDLIKPQKESVFGFSQPAVD